VDFVVIADKSAKSKSFINFYRILIFHLQTNLYCLFINSFKLPFSNLDVKVGNAEFIKYLIIHFDKTVTKNVSFKYIFLIFLLSAITDFLFGIIQPCILCFRAE